MGFKQTRRFVRLLVRYVSLHVSLPRRPPHDRQVYSYQEEPLGVHDYVETLLCNYSFDYVVRWLFVAIEEFRGCKGKYTSEVFQRKMVSVGGTARKIIKKLESKYAEWILVEKP